MSQPQFPAFYLTTPSLPVGVTLPVVTYSEFKRALSGAFNGIRITVALDIEVSFDFESLVYPHTHTITTGSGTGTAYQDHFPVPRSFCGTLDCTIPESPGGSSLLIIDHSGDLRVDATVTITTAYTSDTGSGSSFVASSGINGSSGIILGFFRQGTAISLALWQKFYFIDLISSSLFGASVIIYTKPTGASIFDIYGEGVPSPPSDIIYTRCDTHDETISYPVLSETAVGTLFGATIYMAGYSQTGTASSSTGDCVFTETSSLTPSFTIAEL